MPSFSIARNSSSTFDPASILGLEVSTTSVQVVTVIPRTSLGLLQGDDIDALSYGTTTAPTALDKASGYGEPSIAQPLPSPGWPSPVAFSVRPGAVGLAGTDLAREATCSPAEVAGDEYGVPTPGTNRQVFDENGTPCTTNTGFPFGLLIGDDVDALDAQSPFTIQPGQPIYFSLAPGSPSLTTLGVTPAHILKTASGTTPVVFATPAQLGLQDGDDIDAIELIENGNGTFDPATASNPGDILIFSLRAGSPSLGALGFRPGDLLVPNKQQPGGPPMRAFPARSSGLTVTDDLDALKSSDPMFLWRLAPYPEEPPTPPVLTCVTNPVGGPEAWTPRAPLPIGREGGFGVIIGNRIYVGQGYSAFGDDSFHFIYDIPSNTWLAGAPAPIGRAEVVGVCAEEPVNATTTQAKVFVIGGRSFTISTVLNAVYAYDPVTNTWAAKPPMPTARAGMGAVWVASTTSIYVFGGRDGTAPHSGMPLNVVERYNTVTGTWSTMAPMPFAMMDIYSTVYDPRTNKVYVIGGYDGVNATSTVQIYDVASNTWSLGAPMPTPRSNSLAGFCGGRIHVIGGYTGTNEVAVNEAYDPLTNTWSTGYMPLPGPRSEFMTAVTFTGQEIYAIGDGIFGVGGNVHDVYTCGPRPPPPPPKPSGANLAVFKSASPDPVRVGSNLTYTIVVTNAGPDTATGVLLTDTLPSTVDLVSISPSQGSCIGVGSVTCNLGNIGAGFSASVTIVVRPTQAGKASNTVAVWANEPDPQMGNNRATVTTLVNP